MMQATSQRKDARKNMLRETNLQISPDYERLIRFGANWTMLISPYMILYFILVILIGSADVTGNVASTLEFAGKSRLAFQATTLLDGLFHVLFFVSVITLYIAIRQAYPVRASLLLVCGTWQMLIGFTKGLFASFAFPQLGSAYLTADPTLRASIIVTADAMEALHNAMQWMDSLGVMFVWIIVSLLPSTLSLPRGVRWLGWIMAIAILSPDPAFLLVVLLSPFWLFMLGRWMKSLSQNRIQTF
jgi:hypothetical protein